MLTVAKAVFGIVSLLVLSSLASASDPYCRQRIYHPPAYAVVEPVSYFQIGRQAGAADFAALLDELRALRQDFQKLQAGQLGVESAPPHVALFRANCAACHTEGKLKNNDFALLKADGDLAPLTHAQVLRIVARTYSQDPAKQMPPPSTGKKLRDTDFAVVMNFVESLK